jgi:hypothetical protein
MSIKPINNENHNDNIRPLTRLSKRKNSITSIPELKINNENDNENDKENDNEIRPSSRLTERRTGLCSIPRSHRKTLDICKECLHSIYEDEEYYSCIKCRGKLCFICWENNNRCPGCNSRISKGGSYISFKKIGPTYFHKLFQKFTNCFFCLPKHQTI